MRYLLVISVGLCFGGSALAQDADAPPAAAPVDFSHVVGRLEISASAAPTQVAVEEPITLTVKIYGDAAPRYQPRRHNLRIFPPDLTANFYVEPVPDDDRLSPERSRWEFVYRLRPKDKNVSLIPALRLVYYSPSRKKFQTTFSEEIPITVTAPAEPSPPIEVKAKPLPEQFYKLAPIEEVLRDDRPLRVPIWLAALLFSLPPVVAAVWYCIWRRRDFGVLATRHLRRSESARAALALLEVGSPDAIRVTTIVAEYLRQRFDMTTVEPTPREVERLIFRLGGTKVTRRAWMIFLESGDRERFAPAHAARNLDLPREAARLILNLEAELCISL